MSAVASSSSTVPGLETSREDLVASLSRHNETFTTLLSLIPAQYYIQPTQEEADSKWMKNKKRKTGEEIKESKRKSKASKLDPENNKTTVDILFPSESSSTLSNPRRQPNEPAKSALKPSSASDPEQPEPFPGYARPLPPPASISTLRAKLANKLAAFKSHRAPYPNEISSGDAGDAGPTSRDALEEESRRRRGEIRDNRRRARNEARRNEGKDGQKKGKEGEKGKSKEDRSVQTAKTQLLVPQPTNAPSGDTISFPALALPSSSKSPAVDRTTNFKSLSNPAQALANLQKHNRNMEGMDEDKRLAAIEQERWAKALHRAEGGKVADDEKVLKKAVRRLEKTKGKSGKEWADRKREIAANQSIKIKKRNDNIAAKNQARKDKKMGIKKKDAPKGGKGAKTSGYKGKNRDDGPGGGGGKKGRPGFEGKGKKGK